MPKELYEMVYRCSARRAPNAGPAVSDSGLPRGRTSAARPKPSTLVQIKMHTRDTESLRGHGRGERKQSVEHRISVRRATPDQGSAMLPRDWQ